MHSSINLPNALTFFRALLAFVFLWDSSLLRGTAVILAAISDVLDGYLARRWKQESTFGSTADPLVDKFFVFFIISILMMENKLGSYELFAVLTRDIVLVLFGVYLSLSGQWHLVRFTSSLVGKVVTALQFIFLLALCFHWKLPAITYTCFALLGGCMLIELFFSQRFFKK